MSNTYVVVDDVTVDLIFNLKYHGFTKKGKAMATNAHFINSFEQHALRHSLATFKILFSDLRNHNDKENSSMLRYAPLYEELVKAKQRGDISASNFSKLRWCARRLRGVYGSIDRHLLKKTEQQTLNDAIRDLYETIYQIYSRLAKKNKTQDLTAFAHVLPCLTDFIKMELLPLSSNNTLCAIAHDWSAEHAESYALAAWNFFEQLNWIESAQRKIAKQAKIRQANLVEAINLHDIKQKQLQEKFEKFYSALSREEKDTFDQAHIVRGTLKFGFL